MDFALAFAVAHEIPSLSSFFAEVYESLKAGASLLLAEPAGHVSASEFECEVKAAAEARLNSVDRPIIRRSHTVLLQKA